MKKISILGVTGSIGTQTLDVVRNSDDIEIVGISANSSTKKMKEIIKEFKPKYVAMMKKECAEELEKFCNENSIKTALEYLGTGRKFIA